MSEFPCHGPGEPCPVIDLLHGHFGEDFGEVLLWNFTCFPMGDKEAYDQARKLVAADRVGLLSEYLKSEQDELERQMREGAIHGA